MPGAVLGLGLSHGATECALVAGEAHRHQAVVDHVGVDFKRRDTGNDPLPPRFEYLHDLQVGLGHGFPPT